MDNHLGALWCWLQELRLGEPYVLLHADAHWDHSPMADQHLSMVRSVDGAPLDTLLGLSFDIGLNRRLPVVQWDNYMRPIADLRPGLIEAVLLARQSIPTRPTVPPIRLDDGPPPLPERMPGAKYLSRPADFWAAATKATSVRARRLVNLDLDYFFRDEGRGRVSRMLNDQSVDTFVRRLDETAPDAIWTIAWSPECCGSWAEASAVFAVVDRVLDLGFPLVDLNLDRAATVDRGGCW